MAESMKTCKNCGKPMSKCRGQCKAKKGGNGGKPFGKGKGIGK